MKVSKDTSERLLMIQSLYIFCTLLVGEVSSGSILSIFLVSIVKIIYYTETNKEQTISIRKAMKNYKKLYRKTVIAVRLICCYYHFSMALMKEVNVRIQNKYCNNRTSNADSV